MAAQNQTIETARLAVDSAIGSNAAKATVAGAATLAWGGYTINDMAMAVGAVVAVLGFLVQVAAQLHSARVREREDKRREELHRTKMFMIMNGEPPPYTEDSNEST